MATRRMNQGGKNKTAEESFVRDARRIWNNVPQEIIEAPTIGTANSKIRKYCKTLSI